MSRLREAEQAAARQLEELEELRARLVELAASKDQVVRFRKQGDGGRKEREFGTVVLVVSHACRSCFEGFVWVYSSHAAGLSCSR